jgi:esterase/lipase superfamily enzyme
MAHAPAIVAVGPGIGSDERAIRSRTLSLDGLTSLPLPLAGGEPRLRRRPSLRRSRRAVALATLACVTARHLLLESPALGRRAHVWAFGAVGRPLVVFPSNAGVAHEWKKAGMIDALGPLLAAGRLKVYCPETNVSRSFSGEGSAKERIAHHRAYERFVMETLVPFVREDCGSRDVPIVATGCSVGALYATLFALKHPETFHRALGLSGRYRTSRFFDHPGEHVYFDDPLAFVPNLHGAPLERVRRHAHVTLVVGRGPAERGCITETAELGTWLKRKRIPSHVAFWGEDSDHTYEWWRKQAFHYVQQLL